MHSCPSSSAAEHLSPLCVHLPLSPSLYLPDLCFARWLDRDMHYSSWCPLCHYWAELWAEGCKTELQSINQGLTLTTMGSVDWMSQDIHVNRRVLRRDRLDPVHTCNSCTSLVFYPSVNKKPSPPVWAETSLLSELMVTNGEKNTAVCDACCLSNSACSCMKPIVASCVGDQVPADLSTLISAGRVMLILKCLTTASRIYLLRDICWLNQFLIHSLESQAEKWLIL